MVHLLLVIHILFTHPPVSQILQRFGNGIQKLQQISGILSDILGQLIPAEAGSGDLIRLFHNLLG